MIIHTTVMLIGKVSLDTKASNSSGHVDELKAYYDSILSTKEKQLFDDWKDFSVSVLAFKIAALAFADKVLS